MSVQLHSTPVYKPAPIPKIVGPSKPKTCWHKIWEFIKKIWKAIFRIKEKPLHLEKWQVELITETKFPTVKTLSKKKVEPLTSPKQTPHGPALLSKSKITPQKKYSPALEEMRQAGQEFQQMFTDIWCEEKLKDICVDITAGIETSHLIAKNGIKWDKAEQLIDKVKGTLNDQIYTIVKEKLIQKNAKRFTDLVLCRLAELIEKLEWQEAFTDIVKVSSEQIKAFVASEESVKQNTQLHKQLAMIAHAKSAENVEPNGVQESVNKHSLVQYLDVVMKKGGEKELIQKAFYAGFLQQPACHPIIKNILKAYIEDDATVDLKSVLNSMEKEVYTETTQLILTLLFPSFVEYANKGEKKDVDGLAILWRELSIPEEFDSILEDLKKLGEDVLKEHFHPLVDAKTTIMPHIEQIIVGALKDKLKSFLVALLEGLVEKLTKPKQLQELFGSKILPAIFEAAMRAFVESRLTTSANIHQCAQLFHNIVYASSYQEATKMRSELIKVLYEKTVSKFDAFKITDFEFTQGEFLACAAPPLETIEMLLLENKKLKGDAPTTVEEIEAFLQIYQSAQPQTQPNPKLINHYSEIFMDATFHLGSFLEKKKKFIQNIIKAVAETKLKQMIGGLLDTGLKQFEQSYHKTISASVDAVKSNFFKKNLIKDWILKNPSKEEPDSKNLLASEVKKIAALTYDIIVTLVDENESWWKKLAITSALENNEKLLEKTMKSAITKLFSNTLINKNLIFKLNDIIHNHLKIAQQKQHVQNFSMAKMPLKAMAG